MPSTPDKLAQVRELIAADRSDDAKALLQRILRQSPHDAAANNLLSAILAREGQNDSALFYAERACRTVPDHPTLLQTLGNLQALVGRVDEAKATLHRAAAISPRDPELRLSLARILMKSGDLVAAVEVCEAAARDEAISPDVVDAHAGVLAALGRVDDGIGVLRAGAGRWPQHSQLVSHLACMMNYSSHPSPEEVLEVHKRYGALLAEQLEPLAPCEPPVDPEKRLRLGFVSSDLRQHSIVYFLEPLLAHLDRSRFEVVCYHTCLYEDAVSGRLRTLVKEWRHEPRTAPTPLATMIRTDRIDVLIELAGHTDGQRLAAVHLRPAPVQMTWLGYPNTTGVRAVDARIVDSVTDPAEADALATEKLLRLDPCFICYRPHSDAPAVSARPGSSPVVFGSFGTMQKISDRSVALWAGALAAAPGSRLLIKNRAMSEPAARDALRASLTTAGVGADRVELCPWAEGIADHLSAYGGVDIALDSTPYNGTTTTCEALYMGVPVVTMQGQVHAARVGTSLLKAAGLGALVARDAGHFAAIAGALAADRGALAALRSGLRDRLLASPLCDERGFAERFGALIRRAWRDACHR